MCNGLTSYEWFKTTLNGACFPRFLVHSDPFLPQPNSHLINFMLCAILHFRYLDSNFFFLRPSTWSGFDYVLPMAIKKTGARKYMSLWSCFCSGNLHEYIIVVWTGVYLCHATFDALTASFIYLVLSCFLFQVNIQESGIPSQERLGHMDCFSFYCSI